MRITCLTFFIFLLGFSAFSQTINLQTNLFGSYRITNDQSNQESIKVSADLFCEVEVSNDLEIEFETNQTSIGYSFSNVDFQENDTLILDFIRYYRVDSIHYSASCDDGTEAENTTSFLEKNVGILSIDELPESMVVRLNNREMICKKTIIPEIEVTTGSGFKSGKRWGFHQTTIARKVVYEFSNE